MRVFLSHAGADSAQAADLKAAIERHGGVVVWLDRDELRAGGRWQEALEDAIAVADAFCVLVGARGVVNWVDREVRLALSRATADPGFAFIPILAPGAPSAALPPFAAQHHAVRDPLGNPEQLRKLIDALGGGSPWATPIEDPFVGLRTMDEDQAHLFFGRDEELDDLLSRLRRHPVVAIISDSGAGKSSLVRAGLIPAFRRGALDAESGTPPENHARHVVVMRPYGDLVRGIGEGVSTAAERLGLSPDARAALRRRIDLTDPREAAHVLRCDLPPSTETLLVVDQFEELLLHRHDPAQAEAFVALLLALTDPAHDWRFRLVLTIRADYANLLGRHPALQQALTPERVLRLKRLSEDGLRSATVNPLRLARQPLAGAEALAAALARDLDQRPGDTALAQIALHAAWRRAAAQRIPLLQAYDEVGRVEGALAHTADAARDKLAAEDAARLLPLFARLVRLGDSGGATRRPVRFEDLPPGAAPLARRLVSEDGARLLSTRGAAELEISHEALIRQWGWLQDRIGEAGADMRLLARLGAAAEQWRAAGRRVEGLPNAVDRAAFDGFAARRADWLSPDEAAMLEAARKDAADRARAEEAAQRRARRRRRLVLSGLVAASLGFGVLALRAELAAEDAAQAAWAAEKNSGEALAALAEMRRREGDAVSAVQLALAAWPRSGTDVAQSKAAWAALRAAMIDEPGRMAFVPNHVNLDENPPDPSLSEEEVQTVEWDYLWAPVMTMPNDGLIDAASSVVFSPDGTRLATGSRDRTARIWDAATGAEIARIEGHGGWVRSVAFSPDGARLATGSNDTTARIWDAATGAEVARIEGHGGTVTSVAFSPDGAHLATGSSDDTARIWDAETGEEIGRFEGEGNGADMISIAVSADGTLLAAGSNDGTAWIWDVTTWAEIARFEKLGLGTVHAVAFSPKGDRFVIGGSNDFVRIHDLATRTEVGVLDEDGSWMTSVAFSPDGARLATLGILGKRSARIWDIQTTPINAFAAACAWLSYPDGAPNFDLRKALGAAEIDPPAPICGPGYDPPAPWWRIDGAEPPAPPAAAWLKPVRAIRDALDRAIAPLRAALAAETRP